MLGSLIESGRVRASRGALGGGVVSLLVHSALITGAVYATLRATEPGRVGRIVVPLSYPTDPKPAAPPPRAPVVDVPPVGSYVLRLASVIPTAIPAASTLPFDPTRFLGADTGIVRVWGSDTATGRKPVPGSVYSTDVVEERPERVGGPAPRYPEILRQAGIDGQVTVECVVDTTGRAEPASVRIASSTNPLFEPAAREAVGASLFRPGRLGGHAVRVRVLVPIVFRVSRP
jgi:protein TonB